MALSNIFREPRRELTEQLAGLVLLAATLWPGYFIGSFLATTHGNPGMVICLIIGFVGAAMGWVAVFMVALGMHALGENVCNFLANRGIDPRPKQRY